MNSPYLLIDLAMYLGVVPCLVALVNRKRLNLALWLLWAHLASGTLLGIVAIILATKGSNNHFIYPILALLTSVLMGLFFAELARKSHLKWLIRSLFGLYAGYVLLTDVGKVRLFMNLQVFAPLDVAIFGLSLFFLIQLLRSSQHLARKPLFWVLLALCLGSLYDMVIAQVGTLLAQYGGNRLLDLLWLQINPIVTIIRHCLYAYGFYMVRFQMVKSEKLPQFTP